MPTHLKNNTSSAPKHPHAGHRERMKRQFLDAGLDGFHEHQILEMLLFYCIPQKDTNPLAHTLLSRFGCLYNLMKAGEEEIISVPGVGRHTASFLHSFASFAAGALEDPVVPSPRYGSHEAIGRLLLDYYREKNEEAPILLLLNNNTELISIEKIDVPTIHSAHFNPESLVRRALEKQAATVAVAHKHPGKLLVPSEFDRATTRLLQESFSLLNIPFIDHYLVCDNNFLGIMRSSPSSKVDFLQKTTTLDADLPEISFRAGELLSPSGWDDNMENATDFSEKECSCLPMDTRKLLADLLSFAVRPASRALEITDTLLSSYDNLQYICAATPEKLADHGISEHTAVLLNMVLPAYGAACMRMHAGDGPLTSARDIGSMLVHCHIGSIRETIFFLLLDDEFNKIDLVCVAEGVVNAANFTVRRLSELAYFKGASYAVLSHNHPFGSLNPSPADLHTTTLLRQALGMVGCELLEHFVVSGSRFSPILLVTDEDRNNRHLPPNFYDERMLSALKSRH